MKCPDSEAWLGYLRGESAENQVSSLEDHLATCPQCQVAIELLAEQSDSVLRLIAEAAIGGRATELEQGKAGAKPVREQSFVRETDPRPFVIHEAAMIRDYRIMERIGQGGMGCVYRALHVRLNKLVALKILKPDRSDSPEAVSRFAREMRLLAKLEHPCIVKALDAGEHEGKPYFVMEFVAGIDLAQLVRRLGPLPVPDACQAVRMAASALQFAHDQKVIHRDVKPSNVMIAADGSVKLLDLGLAQIFDLTLEDNISRMDQAVGTFAYMSPEQMTCSQQVTRQSDIFSLGVTLHELLTGQRPFEQRGLPPLVLDIRTVRPDVDVALASLVKEMIALKPAERPLTMTDVVMRIRSIAPTTDLSVLVADYYRWTNRRFTGAVSGAVRADTLVDCATTSKMAQSKSSTVKEGQVTHKSRWMNPLIGASLVIAASTLLAIVYGAGWMTWRKPEPITADSTPPMNPMGTVVISPSDDGEVIAQLMKKAKLVHVENGRSYDVREGDMKLPPGKYELNLNAPVDFGMDGSIVQVTADKTTPLEIEAILKTAFQYPDIPTKPGLFCSYGVGLWRTDFIKARPIRRGPSLAVLSFRRAAKTCCCATNGSKRSSCRFACSIRDSMKSYDTQASQQQKPTKNG